jgi:hypothetical protein
MKKSELNSSMLFKLRDERLCALLDDAYKQKTFYDKEDIKEGDYGGLVSLEDFDDNMLSCGDEDYDIIAIKQLNSCVKVLSVILSDKEPEEWDWVKEVEEPLEETKVENIVQNITINITIDPNTKMEDIIAQLNKNFEKMKFPSL